MSNTTSAASIPLFFDKQFEDMGETLVADASSLGIAPGAFSMTVRVLFANEQINSFYFVRADRCNGDIAGWHYLNSSPFPIGGVRTLLIVND